MKNKYTLIVDTYVNLDSLYSRFEHDQPTGCIHWTGPYHKQGYGMFGGIRAQDKKRVMFLVHRLLMQQQLGHTLTRDQMVIHTCSNSKCVNIDHLVVGDGKLRNQVMAKNGRSGPRARGKHSKDHKRQINRKYKYSVEEMLWARYATKEQIAERYQVPVETARQMQYNFVNKYRWLNELDENYKAKTWQKINTSAG
jgi:hypothetical protein